MKDTVPKYLSNHSDADEIKSEDPDLANQTKLEISIENETLKRSADNKDSKTDIKPKLPKLVQSVKKTVRRPIKFVPESEDMLTRRYPGREGNSRAVKRGSAAKNELTVSKDDDNKTADNEDPLDDLPVISTREAEHVRKACAESVNDACINEEDHKPNLKPTNSLSDLGKHEFTHSEGDVEIDRLNICQGADKVSSPLSAHVHPVNSDVSSIENGTRSDKSQAQDNSGPLRADSQASPISNQTDVNKIRRLSLNGESADDHLINENGPSASNKENMANNPAPSKRGNSKSVRYKTNCKGKSSSEKALQGWDTAIITRAKSRYESVIKICIYCFILYLILIAGYRI